MAADDLATQGARPSATTILTMLFTLSHLLIKIFQCELLWAESEVAVFVEP